MKLLALLPFHEPPAALTGLAAAGHDVHLVATVPGGPPRRHVDGVDVWSLGYWHKALQGVQPDVLLTEIGDRQTANLAERTGRLPHLRLVASAVEDAGRLESALYAAIPAGKARAAAQVPAQPDLLDGCDTRVVAWMHYGLPYRRAGSEVMMQHLLRTLHETGVGVLAITSEMPEAPPEWEVDGVPYRQLPHASAERLMRRIRPHVVVTHHHLSPQAIRVAKEIGARSVLVKHNDHAGQARFLWAGPDLVVYNSRWIRAALAKDWLEVDQIPSLIVHPPVWPDQHRTDRTGDAVTLVNLSAAKGVRTWRAVAEMLPDLPFLGVTGAHGPQETHPLPPNAQVIPQTSDMRGDVWARTRVLLMPSVYESYGMAAVEALASGLPVIAHPTPGLREALGDAAIFIDRDDHQAWADTVRHLYRGGRRRGTAQKAARDRSTLLADQTRTELDQWVQAVRDLAAP